MYVCLYIHFSSCASGARAIHNMYVHAQNIHTHTHHVRTHAQAEGGRHAQTSHSFEHAAGARAIHHVNTHTQVEGGMQSNFGDSREFFLKFTGTLATRCRNYLKSDLLHPWAHPK